ncbi:hypothetical protein Pmani_038550 [Petrolisthes manimaculis]|uniref:Uncharacterized protein n=1 Tax=Petrolisthes manimaculis TaxID=1843537 RepID=A0AAE1NG40_9EUCA|nr:hypothetical protein Pmani_038550 [Petrolisthes manimaculis]
MKTETGKNGWEKDGKQGQTTECKCSVSDMWCNREGDTGAPSASAGKGAAAPATTTTTTTTSILGPLSHKTKHHFTPATQLLTSNPHAHLLNTTAHLHPTFVKCTVTPADHDVISLSPAGEPLISDDVSRFVAG